MHKILIDITKFLLCSLSMSLTGLFAINFAATADSLGNVRPDSYTAIVLLLLIGIAVDLSKYLFWSYRWVKPAYKWVSLGLVFFSWAASVSYFVTQESHQLESIRINTLTYQNTLNRIESLKQTVEQKDKILKKRLGSRYHEQWDKSEKLVHEIATLNRKVQMLADSLSSVGIKEAQGKMGTTSFFLQLSNLTHVPLAWIAMLAYGLLALLIEICALGTLSLSQHIRDRETSPRDYKKNTSDDHQNDIIDSIATLEKPGLGDKEVNRKLSLSKRKSRLKRDILQKKVKPGFTEIKRGKYHVSQAIIKEVLTELYEAGKLEKAVRGFRLAEPMNSDSHSA